MCITHQMPQTQKLAPCETAVYLGILLSVQSCSSFEEELLLHLSFVQRERGTTWGNLTSFGMFRPQLSIYKMGWPNPPTGGALSSLLTN